VVAAPSPVEDGIGVAKEAEDILRESATGTIAAVGWIDHDRARDASAPRGSARRRFPEDRG
jgi:hypothetical protein